MTGDDQRGVREGQQAFANGILMSGSEPPHKSVRPIDPLKSVSPANSSGVCPDSSK